VTLSSSENDLYDEIKECFYFRSGVFVDNNAQTFNGNA